MDMTELCAELRNYFPPKKTRHNGGYIHEGHFIISGGTLAPCDFLKEGQYFRIYGSDLNEGVYKNTPEDIQKLSDEEFDGEIWEMAMPRSVVQLLDDITAWREKYEPVVNSPYSSESFKGYSYTKASGGSGSGASGGATGVTWKTVFADRLNRWRKI